MPSQEQVSTEVKHIGLLRKALIGKHALTIDFNGMEWGGKLSLTEGMFESNDETITCLKNIFAFPVFSFSWQATTSPLTFPLEPKLAFYQALAGVQMDEHRLTSYRESFSKLPPVRLKAGALFRLDAEDMNQYKMLYYMGLAEKGVRISDYLNSDDPALLLRRTRVVLTCYCLGQLIPVTNIKEPTTKMSMAARILARLRKDA